MLTLPIQTRIHSTFRDLKFISNYTFRNFENVSPKSPPKFLIKLCSQPIKRVQLSLAEEMDQWALRLELLLSLLSVIVRKIKNFGGDFGNPFSKFREV